MQRENSILLMAFVLIVAIGFIGVNYGRVTGQAVSGEVTKVIVTPPNAYPGDTITIKIDGKCIDGTLGHTLTLRDALGQRIAAIGIPSNPMIRLGETAERRYTLSTNLVPGVYKVTASDNCAESGIVAGLFKIISP